MKNVWGDQPVIASDTPIKGEMVQAEPAFIEVVNNRIYFYSCVDTDRILRLNKELESLATNLLHDAKVQDRDPANIFLHINSLGGYNTDAYAGMDAILSCKVPVITIVDGCCASAATFLSIVGAQRFMNKHSYMMIHQLSSGFWGKYEEFKDHQQNIDRFMESMIAMYKQYTKVPERLLKGILKHDLWFGCSEALKYGLVDSIL